MGSFHRYIKIPPALLILLLALVMTACESDPPEPPLLTAIDQGNVAVVEEHLEYGTAVNETFVPEGFPFAGASALHVAVLNNDAKIVKMLIEAGADIELRSNDDFNSTPLLWASYWAIPEMVELLVKAGADLESTDAYGTTPLGAAGAENPFVTVGALDEFNKNRGIIKEYLRNAGAR